MEEEGLVDPNYAAWMVGAAHEMLGVVDCGEE